MIDAGQVRQKISDFVPNIKSAKDIFDLFGLLNYPKEVLHDVSYKRKLSSFTFRDEVKDKIKDIYTILNYGEELHVFLIELDYDKTQVSIPMIRALTKSISDSYLNCLLIISLNYESLIFILPHQERIAEKAKLKITTLTLMMDEIKDGLSYSDADTLAAIFIDGTETSWREVWNKWRTSFSVEKVSDKFYKEYEEIFFWLRKEIDSPRILKKDSHEFANTLMNRLMFVYFISRKRWLGDNLKFMKWMWKTYLVERGSGRVEKNSFYDKWLKILFFETLNSNRPITAKHLPKDIRDVLSNAPFLNGGLFSESDCDRLKIRLDDEIFKRLFTFFEAYRFTIKEDMPLNEEVAVDPQMLGYVYERMANVADEIYDRNDLGIVYTPRVEVDFMGRRTLVEYLSKNLTEVPKEVFYEFLFNDDKAEAEKYFDKERLWFKLEEALDNLSVVDPACGSGAFLVGMLNVLVELYRIIFKHLKEQRSMKDFDLKNRIIGRSLYGVDVMPWAIHCAELRLWLQLIIESDIKKETLRKHPLLPNLNLNLRVGDSLVQDVGGINLHLRDSGISEKLKKRLSALKAEKVKYFCNDPTAKINTREGFIKEEVRIFKDIIDERSSQIESEVKELEQKIRKLTGTKQVDLDGEVTERSQRKLVDVREGLQKALEKMRSTMDELASIKEDLTDPEKKPFVWDVDFAEIFGDKGGFDIVVGNPPYVNYKKISPPNVLKKDVTKEQQKEYKEKLRASVRTRFPVVEEIDGMSDLYIYFYFHGLSLLNPKGVFCFITSNFWLDVDYGKDLQEFLLKYVPIIGIYDSSKRVFENALINTVIAVFGAPEIGTRGLTAWEPGANGGAQKNWPLLQHTAKFVMFKKPFEQVLSARNLINIDNIKVKTRTGGISELVKNLVNENDYRVFPILHADLLEEGWEYPEEYERKGARFDRGKYAANKWGGKYLRAPDIFFHIIDNDKMKKIGTICKVKTGLKEAGYGDYIKTRDETTTDNAFPILKNVKKIDRIEVTQNDSFIIKNIRYFKEATEDKHSRILWIAMRGKKHLCIFNLKGFTFTGNFFGIEPNDERMEKRLLLVLNSSLTFLFFEILARKGFGGGSAIMVKTDLDNHMMIFDPSSLDGKKVDQIYSKITRRDIGTIYEELGIDPEKDIREQDPRPQPDRAALDGMIFDGLGLSKEERKEVYWCLCELVKHRHDKAGSLED